MTFKIKSIYFMVFSFLIVSSYGMTLNSITTSIKANKIMTEATKTNNLIGKKIKYDYGEHGFVMSFISENKLHWKCIKGPYKGQEADETYTVEALDSNIFFISWVEKDGIVVSQVANLEKKQIKSFMVIEKKIIPLLGTLKVLP